METPAHPDIPDEYLWGARSPDDYRFASEKYDIFVVGQLIWAMMCCCNAHPALLNRMLATTYRKPELLVAQINRLTKDVHAYSKELTGLVKKCLEYDPDNRPGVQDLRTATIAGVKNGTKRYLDAGNDDWRCFLSALKTCSPLEAKCRNRGWSNGAGFLSPLLNGWTMRA